MLNHNCISVRTFQESLALYNVPKDCKTYTVKKIWVKTVGDNALAVFIM
nr:MAG TPA: Protein of unknown function (DUF1231) [Caudoviricetes sp.]